MKFRGYVFSRREKVLLVILGALLSVALWYSVIFVGTQAQRASLESELSEVNASLMLDQKKLSQMSSWKETIDASKKSGETPTTLPDYDNFEPLMAEFPALLSGAQTYSLDFDEIDESSSEYIFRGITITFDTISYRQAESVIAQFENGKYPCVVDEISLTKKGASRTASEGEGSNVSNPFSSTIHVIFIERR